jgi:hypothetical protein
VTVDVLRDRASVAIGWACLGVLLGALLWTAWQGPDVFYHLALGRAVVESGSCQPADRLLLPQPAYRNVYWLFQVLLWEVWSVSGVEGVSLLFVALWLGVFVLWRRNATLQHYPTAGLPVALLVVLVMQQRFDPRPEVASYLLLVLQLGWLATWRPQMEAPGRILLLFALSEALWVNVHGYFVLGPAVVALRLAAAAAGREGRTALRRIALLLAVTLVATLASPFGLDAWRFVGTLARFLREMRGDVLEFGPPTGVFLGLWTVWLFWVLWAATVVAAWWLGVRRRLAPFPALLAGLGLALSAASIRNLPMLPLLSATLWRDALAELSKRGLARRFRVSVPVITGGVALLLAAWAVNGGFYASLRSEASFGVRLPPNAYPVHAARYLGQHGAEGRILNSAADGGFLELAFPELEVCMDSRYVEARPVRRFFAALTDPAAFRRLDAELRFDAVLLKVMDSGRLVVELLRDPGWELVWGDLHRALLVSRRSRLAARWPAEGLQLDLGDDLTRRVNGAAAIQWTAILIEARDRRRLVLALEQLGRAPRVPSFVIQYALQYGLHADDREVLALASGMAPRVIALAPENHQAVQQLLAAARARR